MGSLGDDLRRARERAGFSRGGLSTRTKIRERLLDAMEHGDFSRLPPGLIARGYLRAYAAEVGLEPEPIVRRYRREFEPAVPAAHPVETTRLTDARIARATADIQRPLWLIAVALFGTTVAFLYAYATARSRDDAKGRPRAVTSPAVDDRESGTPRQWASKRLVLPVGDAGALEYTINGVRGRPLGGAGEVRDVRITQSNRAEFQQQ